MKFLLSALCVLSFLCTFGQTALKPAQIVNTAKTNRTPFLSITFFTPSQQRVSDLDQTLRDYRLLNLDEEQLAQALLQRSHAITLEVPAVKKGASLQLDLVQVNPLADGYTAVSASTGRAIPSAPGIHYRGIINGQEGSIAAISLFEGKIMGLISAPALGNLVIGQLEDARYNGQYVIYQDGELMSHQDFECATDDDGAPDYRPDQLADPVHGRDPGDCVGIYLEVDHDIYQNKGGVSGTTIYITGLFNQVATLYANENVNVSLSEMMIWDTPSPYYGSSSYTLLTQFIDQRPTFNGDLGQLLSYQASGGIAYLYGLCSNHSPRHSFSSINATYANVPTYSFSVMVVTHELGHQMGSKHTHACAWNGNNTAIDGCAGHVEGSCQLPGYPMMGGTIMSYCHLRSVGINFSYGFGTQPGNVIRNAVANASCLQACSDDGGSGDEPSDCEGQTVDLRITLDQYGQETTWEIRDSNQLVMHAGGPYPNTTNGTVITEAMCLEEGCYTFRIFDAYGDGICCEFGEGDYILTDTAGVVLAEGGVFESNEETEFCLPTAGDEDGSDCMDIDFEEYDVASFGGPQDGGYHQFLGDGEVLRIYNNAWKAIEMEYEVTANTVLEFDFGSTIQGEIHGIGFDDNNSISANRTFRLFGTQNWGMGNFDNYPGNSTWKHYTIPVGEFYTGQFDRLFFVADHDRWPRNGNSFFRNIKIYEGEECGEDVGGLPIAGLVSVDAEPPVSEPLRVYPNPADDRITIALHSPLVGHLHLRAFDMTGQLTYQKESEVLPGQNNLTLQVANWPSGTYVLRITAGQQQWTERITLQH